MKTTFILSLTIAFCGCELSDSPDNNNLITETIYFRELLEEEIPPCLNEDSYIDTCVIRNQKDFDSIKIRYAPFGGYEKFTANGSQTRFKLSYQPLDVNYNGKIGVDEVVVYMSGEPIYVTYHDSLVKVSTYPFYVINDSILIFNASGYLKTKIPCSLVFSVDSVTGEIKFMYPPPNGNLLSIAGSKRLYDEFNGRTCNMNYFDFSKYSIIEKVVYSYFPEPRVVGIEKQIIKNDSKKIITYRYKPILGTQQSPEIFRYRSWIALDRIPDNYSVVFEKIK